MKKNVLFLGFDEDGLAFASPLIFLGLLDGLAVSVLLGDPAFVELRLVFVYFRVEILGHVGAELVDHYHDDEEQGEAGVVLVLHDVDLLAAQVSGQRGPEHVRPGHSGLLVEELEPLLGDEAQPDFAGLQPDRPGEVHFIADVAGGG